MKITLSTSGVVGINLINKLFDLGYCPQQLDVWCASSKTNQELINFCQSLEIPLCFIDSASDFDRVSVTGELLLSVVGVPFLVPDHVIEKFSLKAINLHPADTEKYRGRWMVSWCLINNESTVGYTWHYMNNRYDTGNILLRQYFDIGLTDTALSLNARIFSHAIYHIGDVLNLVGTPGTPPTKIGVYYDKSTPYSGKIQKDWNLDRVDRFIRAMYHPPYQPAILENHGQIHYINTIEQFIAQNV